MQAGGRKNRRYRNDQGVLLALLLCGKGLIVNGVVVPGRTVSLWVYRREEGGRNNKYKAQMQHDA